MLNTRVLLARRPSGAPVPDDFAIDRCEVPALAEGQARLANLFVSMDAGFRNWMDEGAGDEVLPAMALNAPVMGLVLGEVVESLHPELSVGQLIMARTAWEDYSVVSSADWFVTLDDPGPHPLSYHLGVLGDTGMSGYFGMTDIARPQPGETVVVSAAGGAVGSVAGQIARIRGARVVGFAGSDEKCARLVGELGYDAAVNHRAPDLADRLAAACPSGIDVYFDNVGGPLLEVVLDQINQGARIPFCGAVADYSSSDPVPGPTNLFRLVAQSARLEGFMTHTQTDRYPEARAALSGWLSSGELVCHEHLHEGVENCGVAFSDLFAGNNFGKTVVRTAEGKRRG